MKSSRLTLICICFVVLVGSSVVAAQRKPAAPKRKPRVYAPPKDLIRLPKPSLHGPWRTFVTASQFQCAFAPSKGSKSKLPTNDQINQWVPILNSVLDRYNIESYDQVVMFLAQTGHETDGYKTFTEYSTTACTGYDGGCKYKGRGAIQLTHKANYALAAQDIEDPRILSNPGIVATDYQLAFETAAWYWRAWGINAVAQSGDFVAVTKKILPALSHFKDRKARLDKIKSCIKREDFAKTAQ